MRIKSNVKAGGWFSNWLFGIAVNSHPNAK